VDKSELKIKVTKTISEIPFEDWSSVYPKAPENYYFFKTIDESGFDQFKFFYIMVYDKEIPVAAAPSFVMRFDLDMTVKGLLRVFYKAVERVIPNIFTPKILMIGIPMGQGRVGIAPGHDGVFEVLCGCFEKIARQERAALINFKDFTNEYEGMLRPLLKRGFIKIESLPSTDMDISFSSFEEYLKSLGRVSRDGIKRKFKKTDSRVKFDLEITPSLDEASLTQVHALYLQTLERQDIGLERLPLDFFRMISKNMPGEIKYFLWRMNGKIVAFALCIISEDQFIDYYLGFDYSVAHEYNLYFIRFRDLMNWCIEHGMKRYEMGPTTYEPKRRLGFRFIRLFFYMKHRNPIINPFLGFISYFMKPESFDPVFKEIKKQNKNSLIT